MDITAKPKRIAWNKGLKGVQVAWNKGKPSPYKGIPRTEAVKKAIGDANRGRPSKYKGVPRTEETKKKISIATTGKPKPTLKGKKRPDGVIIRGADRSDWKGDNVGYSALHDWVNLRLGKPTECQNCGFQSSNSRQFHWANISHEYKRVLEDWARLCVPCHVLYDKGKIELNLKRKLR